MTVITAPAEVDGTCTAVVSGQIDHVSLDPALVAQGWTGGSTLGFDGTNTHISCGCTVAQLTAALAAYVPILTPTQIATNALQALVTQMAPMMTQAQTDIANWATYTAAEKDAATLRTIQGAAGIGQGLAMTLAILQLIEVPPGLVP